MSERDGTQRGQALPTYNTQNFAYEYLFFFEYHFYFPAQLVGCFTLSDLLDKQAVVTGVITSYTIKTNILNESYRCRPFSPPVSAFNFYRAWDLAFPLLVDFHRMLQTHALALSADHFFYARQSPYEYVHSVRIELAKFILVGTRITYQATGECSGD